jgi:methionine aminopeptidase
MAENQHRLIKGYRELTQHEIDLINKIKAAGTLIEQIIEEVEHTNLSTGTRSELDEIAEPEMWTHQAKINLKIGLMALTRAVAKPTSF